MTVSFSSFFIAVNLAKPVGLYKEVHYVYYEASSMGREYSLICIVYSCRK